jgi:ABC-type nitrate/sulfonate/bicarbonate transport system permease component
VIGRDSDGEGLSPETKERILSIVSPIALLALWQVMSWLALIDPRFLPSPLSIAGAAYDLSINGELLRDIGVSLERLALGFVLGAVPGIVIGLIMGMSRWIRAVLDPIVAAAFPIPKISLLPLIMLYFGIGEASKVVLVALGVVFLLLINTMAGVANLDPVYFDVARNFGASRRKLLMRVVIPGTLPLIFVGLRLGIGVSLIVVVSAEFVAAQSGIGYLIWSSWETMRVENMFVGIIVITILGAATTVILREIERRAMPWRRDRA